MQLDAMCALQRVVAKPALIQALQGLARDVLSLAPDVERVRVMIDCDGPTAFDLMLLGPGDVPLGGCSL